MTLKSSGQTDTKSKNRDFFVGYSTQGDRQDWWCCSPGGSQQLTRVSMGVTFTANGQIICLFTANGYLFSVTVNLCEIQRNVPCDSD